MRVRDLLDVPGLGLSLLTDASGMDRTIRHVYTTDLPDPSRYLTPGDLVLTGLMWCREPGDADLFVSALVKAGVAALGAGEALGQVPAEVIQAMGRGGFLSLNAYGEEANFAWPERPQRPQWVVKVRYRSTTSAMLGQPNPMGGGRGGDDEDQPSQQQQQQHHGGFGGMMGGLGGFIP